MRVLKQRETCILSRTSLWLSKKICRSKFHTLEFHVKNWTRLFFPLLFVYLVDCPHSLVESSSGKQTYKKNLLENLKLMENIHSDLLLKVRQYPQIPGG